ncbi:ParA family protein [Candidatus Enterovibrio escicola]|uniref:ParA family protein n=1 Tax=Candidatus Enterovibrio escicola TaxID=1927127 RepID=UPI0012383D51|nr:ParA family protein [Candidatus Enterovibrio escacola]
MKYIIFYSTKGGVGKSTNAKMAHLVLAQNNLKRVAGEDIDPQQHYADWLEAHPELVSRAEHAHFYIYDTQGAHTEKNIELLNATKEVQAVILVPVRPSKDDIKEAKRIAKRLTKIGVMDKVIFFLNGCVANSNHQSYRDDLISIGRVARKQINARVAFAENPKSREDNDMSALLLEVLL